MKSFVFILSLMTTANFCYGQSRLPNSYVNIAIGIGPNYGNLGVKTVIGYEKSGMLVSGYNRFDYMDMLWADRLVIDRSIQT